MVHVNNPDDKHEKQAQNKDLSPGIYGPESNLFANVKDFSVGVFGFSFTMLGVNFVVTEKVVGISLSSSLEGLIPVVIAFVVSVFMVALYWWEHYQMFNRFYGIDKKLAFINIIYLAFIVLIPVSSNLLGRFADDPGAYVIFGSNLFVLNMVGLIMNHYARQKGLTDPRGGKTELIHDAVITALFAASVPLSFLFVNYTPLVWFLSFPIDYLVDRIKGEKR